MRTTSSVPGVELVPTIPDICRIRLYPSRRIIADATQCVTLCRISSLAIRTGVELGTFEMFRGKCTHSCDFRKGGAENTTKSFWDGFMHWIEHARIDGVPSYMVSRRILLTWPLE